MIGKIVIGTLIIAIAVAFFFLKFIFASMHIHDSKPMRERGIHCVLDQDREMRRKSWLAVKEKVKR